MCSYWASSPSLSSEARFPYFGRTYPSDVIATVALPEMIKALGWSNLAVIHTNDAYGIDYAEGLRSNALDRCGLTVHAAVEFDQNNADSIRGAVASLQRFSKDGGNIFVAISTDAADLSVLLYEAEEQGLVGGNYTWITTDSVNAGMSIEQAPDQARSRRLMDGVINVRQNAWLTLGSNTVSSWRVLMDGPYGVGWPVCASGAGRGAGGI